MKDSPYLTITVSYDDVCKQFVEKEVENMAVKFQAKQGVGKTTVEGKHGGTQEEEQALGAVLVSEEPLANVGFMVSHTKNLGNYESIKIQVSANVPCQNTEKAMNAAFEFASEWIDAKMAVILSEVSS